MPIRHDDIATYPIQGCMCLSRGAAVGCVKPGKLLAGQKLIGIDHRPGTLFLDLGIEPIEVISEKPLWEYVPCFRVADAQSAIATQFATLMPRCSAQSSAGNAIT